MARIFNIKGHSNYCEKSDLANMFDVDTVIRKNGDAYRFYNMGSTVIIDGAGKQEQPLTFRVSDGDTWLGISYQLYGNVRYWWILAKLNNCKDATDDPVPGTDIFVLTDGNIKEIVNSLRT